MPRPRKDITVDLSNRANSDAFKEFQRDLMTLNLNIPKEIKNARLRIGMELYRLVRLNTPVDKGQLRNHWFVNEQNEYVEVVNNAQHASPVEFGYKQKKRWVPGRWQGDKFIFDKNAKTGMMLTPKRIKGRFMLRLSVKQVGKAIPEILKSALDNAVRRAFR